MPKEIQDAGLSTALVERYRLVGKTLFQLDETLVPVVVVADLSAHAFSPKFGGFRQGGVALRFTRVTLTNPAGSGVMGVLQFAQFSIGIVGAVSNAFLVRNDALGPAATLVSSGPRDFRLPTAAAVLEVRQETTVAGPAAADSEITIPPDSVVRVDGPFYLPPGSDLGLHLVAVNTPLVHNWEWDEIPEQLFGL